MQCGTSLLRHTPEDFVESGSQCELLRLCFEAWLRFLLGGGPADFLPTLRLRPPEGWSEETKADPRSHPQLLLRLALPRARLFRLLAFRIMFGASPGRGRGNLNDPLYVATVSAIPTAEHGTRQYIHRFCLATLPCALDRLPHRTEVGDTVHRHQRSVS